MKKKIFALVLALVMALSLAACGDSNTPAGSGSGSGSGSGEEPVNISGDLVICSSATDLDLEAITEGFTALYPDVNIEIITCSACEGVARVEAEGDNPTIDVFNPGGLGEIPTSQQACSRMWGTGVIDHLDADPVTAPGSDGSWIDGDVLPEVEDPAASGSAP